MATKKEYDKALFRLITIISMLIKDERPTIQELAIEFNVSIRTIQIDIYSRLHMFDIKKDSNNKLVLGDCGVVKNNCFIDARFEAG